MGKDSSMKAAMESGFKRRACKRNLAILVAVLATNLVALCVYQALQSQVQKSDHGNRPVNLQKEMSNDHHQQQVELLDATTNGFLDRRSEVENMQLTATKKELEEVHEQLQSVRRELEESLTNHRQVFDQLMKQNAEIAADHDKTPVAAGDSSCPKIGEQEILKDLSPEFQHFIAPRKLPLGWNPALSSDTMVLNVGHGCVANKELLDTFMNYQVGGVCPDDDDLAQKLMGRGCEPLPRRRYLSSFTASLPCPLIPANPLPHRVVSNSGIWLDLLYSLRSHCNLQTCPHSA